MAIIYGKNTTVDYKASNLASFGKSYSRMGAAPLDMTEVWYDKAALIEYASNLGTLQADGSYDTSSVVSYVGQRVVYVDETNGIVYNYAIQLDGSLKEIGKDVLGVAALTESKDGFIPRVKWVADHAEIEWVEAELTDTVITVSSEDNSATITKNENNYDIKVNFPDIDIPEAPEYAVRKEERDGYHGVYHLTKDSVDVDVEIAVPETDLSEYAKTSALVDYTVKVTARDDIENEGHSAFKHYIFEQCGNEIAHIDVPRDLVVKEGRVREVISANIPYDGAQIGDKYIELIIANQEDQPLYIPANALVDDLFVSDTKTVDLNLDADRTLTANVRISAEAGNSLEAKDDGLYVNAPVLPTKADSAVENEYVTAVSQENGVISVSRKQISYNELADRPENFGILDVDGVDAIDVSVEDQVATVSLKLDNTGNVEFSQSENGLKAEVEIPGLELGAKVSASVADTTYTHEVVASVGVNGHTVTPTVVDVVTSKAWDKITNAGTGETAVRLISQTEIDKLSKLNLENGDLSISGSVEASSVKGLYSRVIDIVKGSTSDLDPDAEGNQLGLKIEAGAQVNKIEEIGLPDAVLSITSKKVSLPAATADAYGVIKHSIEHVATNARLGFVLGAKNDAEGKAAKNAVYVDTTGAMSVKAISTDILEQGTQELVLCGGNAQ